MQDVYFLFEKLIACIATTAGVGTWVQHPGRSVSASRAARQTAGNGDSEQQRRPAMGWCGTGRKDRAQVRLFVLLLQILAVDLVFALFSSISWVVLHDIRGVL